MQQDRANVRLLIIAGVALFWMAAVFARLGYLQLFQHSEYLARAQRQQQRTIEITPERGAIYDRNMRPLAMSIPVDSAFAVPAELADEHLAARLLSSVLNIPPEALEARFESSRSFVWVMRKLPPEKAEAIAALNLKGVYFQKENQRFYPKRDLAAHVLGYVDVDEKGLAGIEYALNDQIRTKPGRVLLLGDARHRLLESRENIHDTGASVVLTLDEKIQYIAEKELARAIAETGAIAGTIVIQDPANGELLAVANWPRFNPNAAKDTPPEMMMDRAVSALYEPGSTFKIITLAAALEEAITRPDEVVDCQNGAIYIAGHRIRDHKPFGLLPVSQVLAQSSDVGAIKIALRLGAPKFYDYIRAFGFGAPTGIDLPGESKGILRRVENWTPISVGSISMGQEVGVTPVQLITAVSAIANGGLIYRPHVVKELRREGQPLPVEEVPTRTEPRRAISAKTAATLRWMLEGVVREGTRKLARLDGWTAAGKTGSAQKIDPGTGRYSPTQLIASFTGFAPLSNPAVTILISLDSPVGLHEGGQVAAPVFKRVAEQVLSYLDVPRDVPLNPRLMQAAYKRQISGEATTLEDFSPTDFSGQPDTPPAASNQAEPEPKSHAPEVTMAADEGGDISVPDFSGKTMREVTETCLRLGLEPLLVGSNLATQQHPEAGTQVRRGAKVTVQFGTPPAKSAKAHGRSRH